MATTDPIGFATSTLAAGAQATCDMIVDAWIDGANTPVGYRFNVRDIESGKVRSTRELFGADQAPRGNFQPGHYAAACHPQKQATNNDAGGTER
jgi:hypothetical protein